MPVLRRAHDRHRDLRTRMPAQIPSAIAKGTDEDRHLMRRLLPDFTCTTDHDCRWSLIGNGGACPKLANWAPQNPRASLTSRINAGQKHQTGLNAFIKRTRFSSRPSCNLSDTPRAAAKSPKSSRHILSTTARDFLPWRLSDAGPGARRNHRDGRHPKPFT